jgi:serine palmitoyltransferase
MMAAAAAPTSSGQDIPAPLIPVLAILASAYRSFASALTRIPGSPIVIRYIESSYQNDPYRSILEVLLLAFAVRTLLKGRTRGDASSKNWVKLREDVSRPTTCRGGADVPQEIDELVDEWVPQALVDEPSDVDKFTLSSVPVIYGPNGLHVKLSPNGKTVSSPGQVSS